MIITKGDKLKFIHSGKVFTADWFSGADGKPHDTYTEARQANPESKIIMVCLKETGGFADCSTIQIINPSID